LKTLDGRRTFGHVGILRRVPRLGVRLDQGEGDMNLKTWQIGLVMTVAVGATLQMEVAQASKMGTILRVDNATEFSAVVAAVQKEMLPGGRFEFVDSKEHDIVNTRLADMQALFDKHVPSRRCR
jgi:hypothetical protein